MMRVFAFLGFLLLSFYVAAHSRFPTECHAFTVQGEVVTIDAKKNSLVLMHNLTSSDLWLTHPIVNPSASSGWTTRLQSRNWAALVLKKGPFVLNCIESKPGHEQQVPCEGEIAVCKWNAKKVKIPVHAKGTTFWVAEDMPFDALIAAIGARGFKINLSENK